MYAVADTVGNWLYFVACNIQGQDTKVFVVQDPAMGLEVLVDESLAWTVTGGVVESCFPIALQAAGGPG